MPRRLPTPCTFPGCPALCLTSRCDTHTVRNRSSESPRPSAHARGYGRQWQAIRLAYLRAHPLCVECNRPATDVDHIVARAKGGKDDESNLQALCHSCHSRKTNAQDGGGWKRRRTA